MDTILYQLWLWLSTRWFQYRITGMNKETYGTEVLIFASSEVNMDDVLRALAEKELEGK